MGTPQIARWQLNSPKTKGGKRSHRCGSSGRHRSTKRLSSTAPKYNLSMILGDPNRGWSDPIGTFMRLQLAVKILASGNGQRNVRMDEATSALTGLIPEYFPAALRERAKRVLSVRERIRRERGSNLVSFRFDLLKQKEYAELTQDILSLYEACIFDMAKEIRDIVHPNDE